MDALMGLLILVAIISLVAKHPGGFLIALFILIVLAVAGKSEANINQEVNIDIRTNIHKIGNVK